MRKIGEPDYWTQFPFESAWKGMHLFTFRDYLRLLRGLCKPPEVDTIKTWRENTWPNEGRVYCSSSYTSSRCT